ncbi:MAG: FAD-dependent oxidoreductase [Verrucomicrobiota bacterium]
MIEGFDIAIVGAGISGLLAARRLRDHYGMRVVILEKSFGVGGRMASRFDGHARFDHGAQYFTAREERFRALVDDWLGLGLIKNWRSSEDDFPRYVGHPSITSVAHFLAEELDLHQNQMVISAQREDRNWLLKTESGTQLRAACLLLTPPVPQALGILDAGGAALTDADNTFLRSIQYAKCIALLGRLDGPSNLVAPGMLKFDHPEPITWIGDNQQKGVSGAPSITIHSGPEFAERYFDKGSEELKTVLFNTARPFIRANLLDWMIHRWRYALRLTEHDREYFADPKRQLWMAGDGFSAPRIEGAAMSGLAVADAIAQC